ncbi:hypothetical protein N185_17460 [Sinorhizobium sp. GW3]|nr:hypothetical protein N185_17460 [Sinorhizobium sp. GW3]
MSVGIDVLAQTAGFNSVSIKIRRAVRCQLCRPPDTAGILRSGLCNVGYVDIQGRFQCGSASLQSRHFLTLGFTNILLFLLAPELFSPVILGRKLWSGVGGDLRATDNGLTRSFCLNGGDRLQYLLLFRLPDNSIRNAALQLLAEIRR